MDAVVKTLNPVKSVSKPAIAGAPAQRPTREEAEAAVRVLLRWAGDNPSREGLLDTPKRVVKAYEELFKGYTQDAEAQLSTVFEEVEGYDDMVLVKDIPFTSHCEHHMVPFVGKAHVAYFPAEGVVGLSKLARVVEVFARRLQTQETMTAQICDAMTQALDRKTLLGRLADAPTWDLAIVGGGATGLGVALDAVVRGFSVVLLEAEDFAKGTSSRATKLVHGGVRYLAQGNLGHHDKKNAKQGKRGQPC